ncbi:MAG: sugar ABC transporter permease [Clostridia bacterium]|nr:sugar ABC transporter permease [Clostridia bacterium]
MNKLLSNKWVITAFVLPTLLFFLGIVIVPLFITGYYSLFNYNGLINIADAEFVGAGNYIKLFTGDSVFLVSLKNTAILIIGSVFVQIPLAFLLANRLAKGIPGEKAFRTIFFIPVVIAATIIGKLFYYIFSADIGMVNAIVRALGVPDFYFNWLTNPATAFLCVAFAAIWQYIGYHMIILYAGIKSISADYFEAAVIDGATGAKATRHITIPLLAPVVKTCVVLATVGSVKTYDIVVSMVGSGSHSGTQVPAILLWRNLFKGRLVGYGSAQAFFLVVVCLLLSYLIARLFKKSEENASQY